MEINKFTDIMGTVALEDIVEGRMVVLASQALTNNFGTRSDLPGVRLPDSAADAARARYMIAFSVDNRELPLFQPTPSYTFSLRSGFGGQAANVPFETDVYLTHPGNMESQTIPSGSLALAFDRGVFTVPSGQYVYNANLQTPGTYLSVAYTDADGLASAGKFKYSATASIAVVEHYDTTTGDLTVRTL